MMSKHYSRAALLALTAVALTLPACAGKKVKGDTAYIARDVNTLYGLAKESLDRSNMSNRPSCSTRSNASILIRSGRAVRS
jgi:hypothetical protein